MNYKRFEDLPVWNDAIEFAVRIFEFTEKAKAEFQSLGDMKNQLERASISISNNIAEGFERGSNTELINFLYISRGSCGECRSMTFVLGRIKKLFIYKKDILDLRNRAEKISKQLFGWIESLKNSEIKGEKFFTEKERQKIQQIKEDKEFKELLQKVMRGEKVDFDKL